MTTADLRGGREMANKSKKRIKHEQYVYIKKLEREIKTLRANAVMYDPVVLKVSRIISSDILAHSDDYRERIAEMVFEEACREMSEQLMKSGAVEIEKTREFDVWRPPVDRYNYTLKVLKRRY